MGWRLAKSLEVLRSQVNDAYPKRSKASDGTIGDAAHASRSSDHNPWVKDGNTGIVTGMDLTHDPSNGLNSEALAEALRASKDGRIKYVISNGKIFSGTGQKQTAWKWRKYTGSNKHNKHVHISVKSDKRSYDLTLPWDLGATAPANDAAPEPTVPAGGDPQFYLLQTRLKALGYPPGRLDGLWGGNTAGAVAGFLNDIPVPPNKLGFAPPVSEKDARKVLPDLNRLLTKAETLGFTRPIAPERAEATPTELAPHVPEIAAAQKASFWSKVQGWWQATFGAVSGTAFVSSLVDAKQTVDPIKESFFSGNTSIALGVIGVVAIVAIAIFLAKKGVDAANASAAAATEAFQTGERL